MRSENRQADCLSTSRPIQPDLYHLASEVHCAQQALAKISTGLKSFVDRQLREKKNPSDACASIDCAFGLMLDIQEVSARLTAFAQLIETAGNPCSSPSTDATHRTQCRYNPRR